MRSEIFRKVALERISSPEQLDAALVITSPRSWAALLALCLLLGTAVAWGFKGSISTGASGQGVIVRRGGVFSVVAAGSGVVTELKVNVGDRIRRGEVVARVAQPALVDRIRAGDDAIREAQRQREVAQQIRAESVKLQINAIQRQRENARREIKVLQDQRILVAQQIPVEADLLAKGLITRQQTFAAKQRLVDIDGQIAALNAQLQQFEAQQYTVESEPVQADIEMRSRIAGLERARLGLARELESASTVTSPYSGEVIEMKVVPGNTVTAGAPLFSIQPDVSELEVLAYVPSVKVKDIQNNMEAQISPSTVRREEYGFLRGRVQSVADYPATPAALMRSFQNESLVQALTGSGPITELRVELEPDPQTQSKYRWSSPAGPPVTLTSGTICSVRIITRSQRPISLVIPYIKEKLGVR